MIALPTRAAVERALADHLPQRLADLLGVLHFAAIASGLADMTHYVIVRAGDAEADLVKEIGLTPTVNPINGARFGTGTFQPWWDWLADRSGFFHMVITVGNGDSAYVLLIEDVDRVPADLLELCRRHAE